MTLIKTSRIENISEKNCYFLGNWTYSFHNEIDYGIDYFKRNTQIHPWSNFQTLNKDKEYLYEFYERLLKSVIKPLNNFHKTNYSKRYWEIIIGNWLHMFTFINLDQWRVVEKCLDTLKEDLEIQEFDTNELDMTPESLEHCKKLYLSDSWRQYNFVKIFKYFDQILYGDNKINFKSNKFKETKNIKNFKENFSIKTKLASLFNKIFSKKLKNQKYFIARSYLSKIEETKLNFMMSQFPNLSIPDLNNLNVSFNKISRLKFEIDFKPKNEFEKYILKIFSKQIPLAFLEGHNEVWRRLNKMNFPVKPKTIFVTNFQFKSYLTRYCAEKTEIGAKLFYGQHGGCYGQFELHWCEYFEKKISDKFLTWGWKDQSLKNKTYPIGILRPLPKTREKNFNNKKTLLMLVATQNPSVLFVDSRSGSQRTYKHFENCNLIINELNAEIQKKNLLLRLPANRVDHGWNENERYNYSFPKIKKEKGNKDIFKLINQTRIFISPYIGTGYLETLAMNIPTVVLYDKFDEKIRDECLPIIKEMKNIQIFFDDPKKLSEHINKTWGNVEEWWLDKRLQETKNKFCKIYAKLNKNKLGELKLILQDDA